MSNTTQNLRRNYTSLVLAALQDSNFESRGFLLSLAVVIHHYLSRARCSSCYTTLLIHGSNKSENQKEKTNSTLNHSHAVVAPHRGSSTHHTPLTCPKGTTPFPRKRAQKKFSQFRWYLVFIKGCVKNMNRVPNPTFSFEE